MLRVTPCIPASWTTFKLHYRYRDALYRSTVVQCSAADSWSTMTLDGVDCPDHAIVLVDDRREHAVHVRVQRTQD